MILVVDVGNTKLKLLFLREYPLQHFVFCKESFEKILKYFKNFTNTKYLVVASVGNIEKSF
jgi:pantothenate kinase type III